MRKILMASAMLLSAPAWGQTRSGFLSCPVNAPLVSIDQSGSCTAVNLGTGLSMSGSTLNGGSGATVVTNTYTTSGAIAPTDTYAAFNSASALSMTLANGTVDGHQISLEDYGAGAVTVSLSYYGAATTITINQTGIRNLFWNAATSTYRNAS